jgi:hypothetical protein
MTNREEKRKKHNRGLRNRPDGITLRNKVEIPIRTPKIHRSNA